MQWSEIRERYPRQWLLVEAVKAHSEEEQRILDDLEIVEFFPDSVTAMRHYQELHRLNPYRELYVLHTNRERLDIGEIHWLRTGGSPHPTKKSGNSSVPGCTAYGSKSVTPAEVSTSSSM